MQLVNPMYKRIIFHSKLRLVNKCLIINPPTVRLPECASHDSPTVPLACLKPMKVCGYHGESPALVSEGLATKCKSSQLTYGLLRVHSSGQRGKPAVCAYTRMPHAGPRLNSLYTIMYVRSSIHTLMQTLL